MTRILVADDSAATRYLLRTMLEADGYAVVEAPDGIEALNVLRASAEPMVVVLDYQMPNLDGAGVLTVVAEDGGAIAAHEFLVISGNVSTFPAVFIDLLRHLSIRILAKPVDRATLLAVVSHAAERLHASPELPAAWYEA